mmetsp:Transcript_50062/g.81133  ORF Transcript_50062/g.81133 Transcript_50062/m.81133 type:complete len:275 (+) Transcript_50062:65-889(+)
MMPKLRPAWSMSTTTNSAGSSSPSPAAPEKHAAELSAPGVLKPPPLRGVLEPLSTLDRLLGESGMLIETAFVSNLGATGLVASGGEDAQGSAASASPASSAALVSCASSIFWCWRSSFRSAWRDPRPSTSPPCDTEGFTRSLFSRPPLAADISAFRLGKNSFLPTCKPSLSVPSANGFGIFLPVSAWTLNWSRCLGWSCLTTLQKPLFTKMTRSTSVACFKISCSPMKVSSVRQPAMACRSTSWMPSSTARSADFKKVTRSRTKLSCEKPTHHR